MWAFDIGVSSTAKTPMVRWRCPDASKTKSEPNSSRRGPKKFRYTYDFGDNWDHVIQIEKVGRLNPGQVSSMRQRQSCLPTRGLWRRPGVMPTSWKRSRIRNTNSTRSGLNGFGGEFRPGGF